MVTLNITGDEEKYETEDLINEGEPSIRRSTRRTSQKEEIKSSNSQDLWIQETETRPMGVRACME